jgi:hypothetical protein
MGTDPTTRAVAANGVAKTLGMSLASVQCWKGRDTTDA